MKNRLKKRRLQIAALLAAAFSVVSFVTFSTTTSATAGECLDDLGQPSTTCIVPEISALEGTAALAVIAAILLLAWERRQRV